tara:strand:+ start:1365 stop:2645 length:1281 start_codon:yes stop_codon:yes gene_type:complete
VIKNIKNFQVINHNSNDAIIRDVIYEVNNTLLSDFNKNLQKEDYLCVCSGGTTSSCAKNNFITIDLRKEYSQISFEEETGIVQIGGGTQMGNLVDHLEIFDRTFPIGLSKLPGAGYILTGGISPLSRRYGLAIDNILFIKGYLGNGNYFELNKNNLKEEDLNLWTGIKGAAPFFAIITQIGLKTFKAYPVLTYEGFVNANELGELIFHAEKFPINCSLQWFFSDKIYVYIFMELKTSEDNFNAEKYHKKLTKYSSLKRNYFKNFNKLNFFPKELNLFKLSRDNHSEVISMLGEDLKSNIDQFIKEMIKINIQKPNKSCYVASQQLGGVTSSVSKKDSCFIHRQSTWKPWIYASWEKNNVEDKKIALDWMNNSWQKLKKFYPKIHLAQLHNHLNTHKEEVNLAFDLKLNNMKLLKNFCDPSGNLPPL